MKRRAFLAALPAAPLAALPVPETAAKPVYVKVGSPALPREEPWARAHRLARELSDALATIRDADGEFPGGMCVAVVHPSGEPYSIAFVDIDSYDEGWRFAREEISRRVKDRMSR